MVSHKAIKKVHVVPDPRLVHTPEDRAVLEILLEICDNNLDVVTSSAEVQVLAEVYWGLYQARPFPGLHELVMNDAGVCLFFKKFKELVLPILDLSKRSKQFSEVYRSYTKEVDVLPATPWSVALYKICYDAMIFELSYKLAAQTKRKGKQISQ